MRFACERDVLVEVLGLAGRAVNTRADRSLSGLQLEAQDSELRVTGTDRDLTIATAAPAQVLEGGVGVINAKLIHDIVRSLRTGRVVVEVETDKATVTDQASRSVFEVPVLPPMEFPRTVEPDGAPVTLDAASFLAALSQVLPAASTDPARQQLQGVQVEAEGTGVTLAATDSYRLAVRHLPGTTLLEEGQSVLVPQNALHELARIAVTESELILRLGTQSASFTAGSSRLITNLIDQTFPTYRNLIPDALPNALTVSREELLGAVKRVGVVRRDATTPVQLEMKPEGLELRVSTMEFGSATEVVDAKFDGQELKVAFNPDYLTAGVAVAVGDEVTIETSDGSRPALLRDPASPDFRYVLMPVRVSSDVPGS